MSKTLADDRSALSSVDYTDVEQVEAIARVAQGAPVSNNGQGETHTHTHAFRSVCTSIGTDYMHT